MPTFFARRYGRPGESVSATEKVIGAGVLLALVALGVTAVRALTVRLDLAESTERLAAIDSSGADRPSTTGHTPFALPGLSGAGWSGPLDVQAFTPKTVHEKINGRDGLYLAYGIAGMTFGTYKHGADDDRYVDVYVYDMGETLNAFGCYKAEFAEDMPAIRTGRGGYRAETSLFYWKGSHYVQFIAGDTVTEQDVAIFDKLAEKMADQITDDGAVLWGDDLLPKANRKPGSLAYDRENGLSLDFLNGVFRATYTDGDAETVLFVVCTKSPEQANGLLDQYAAYLGKHGKIHDRSDTQGGRTVAGEVLEMYDVVFCKGPYLGGVNGADDMKLARKHAEAFREALKTN